MIVRGTATAAKHSHRVLLALPHRAHARSSDVERSAATNEAAEAECSHERSGATAASAAATGRVITRAVHEAVQLGRRSCGANRRGNEGLFKTGDRKGRQAHVQHVSRTVPLTVKLSGRPRAPPGRRDRVEIVPADHLRARYTMMAATTIMKRAMKFADPMCYSKTLAAPNRRRITVRSSDC